MQPHSAAVTINTQCCDIRQVPQKGKYHLQMYNLLKVRETNNLFIQSVHRNRIMNLHDIEMSITFGFFESVMSIHVKYLANLYDFSESTQPLF